MYEEEITRRRGSSPLHLGRDSSPGQNRNLFMLEL